MKISNMTAADALTGAELMETVQGGNTRRLTVAQILDLIRSYISLVFFGEATDEQIFGYFKASQACEVIGMQISAQEAPTGADLTVDLVDGADSEQTKIGTLAAGEKFQETIFGAPLAVAAAGVLKGKFKQVGSVIAGNGITVTLILKPNL